MCGNLDGNGDEDGHFQQFHRDHHPGQAAWPPLPSSKLRGQPGRTMIFAGLALVDDCPMGWNGCAGCLERNAMVACRPKPNGASLCSDTGGPQEGASRQLSVREPRR